MASRVDIQISILKFNFQPRFWFHFSFPYRGWLSNMVGRVKILISEFDFDFQIFISPSITQYRIGAYNIALMIMSIYYILCLTLYIHDVHSTPFIPYPHNHFTLFLINIVTFYTFFQRVCATFTHFSRQFYAEWWTRIWYAFDIRCPKPYFVVPTFYALSHFVAFIFYVFLI